MINLFNIGLLMVRPTLDHLRAYLAPFFNSPRLTWIKFSTSSCFTHLISVLLIYSVFLFLSVLFAQSIGSGIAYYSDLLLVTVLTHVNETFILISGNDPGVLISLAWGSIGIENTQMLGKRPERAPGGGGKKGGKKVRALFKLFSLDILDKNSDILLSENLIIELINSFWVIVFSMHKDKVILAQIQLQTDTNYKSLSKQITVSFSEKEVFTGRPL